MKKIFVAVLIGLLFFSMLSMLTLQAGSLWKSPLIELDRTYGGTGDDVAHSVVRTSDGGYAIAGYTNSFGFGSYDFWLVKTDENGNMQWNKTYGGTGDEFARSIVQTDDGGYALAGETTSFGAGGRDFWLVKTDQNGNMQWNKTYGGGGDDWASCVVQTRDRGYAITGVTASFGAGAGDFWLIKTDRNGNAQWNKTYGGPMFDQPLSVVQTSDEGYALAGETRSFGNGQNDAWLIKTDRNGNAQWNKTYGGPMEDVASMVIQTSDEGYALAGETRSFGVGDYDFWLVKTDRNGVAQWNKTYGGPSMEFGSAIVQTVDGGYAIMGDTYSFGAGGCDLWLVKTDLAGNMQWNATYGGASEDHGESLIQTCDGGYALVGWTSSFGAGERDFWLIKLAPEEVTATVDIDPNTLNLKSKGQWITCYIELPKGYDVHDINITSIKLNDTISVVSKPTNIGDYNHNGVPDLMVKFDREAASNLILANWKPNSRSETITLTLTGMLNDGIPFRGSNTITAMLPSPGGGKAYLK
jgi:predicted secreted protein